MSKLSKLPRLKDRIRAALANGQKSYAELARDVFPDSHYPKAFNYQANGGPPGCYMALSRALREMGDEVSDYARSIGPGNRDVRLLKGK